MSCQVENCKILYSKGITVRLKFLVCDEISTMLDVITQAQIWNLLLKISDKNKLGMLVVTHNIELAKKVCNRIIELPKINNEFSS